jgi:hypothetical protein
MKNREKFRDEIVGAIKEDNDENGKMCCFLKDNVIPRFISEGDMELGVCGGLDCHTCAKMFAFWLEEEYIEPPKPKVNWSKVPVDTLVQVRDDENDKWALRYFKWFVNGHRTPVVTWAAGATSKTAEGCTEYWKYCELAEEE